MKPNNIHYRYTFGKILKYFDKNIKRFKAYNFINLLFKDWKEQKKVYYTSYLNIKVSSRNIWRKKKYIHLLQQNANNKKKKSRNICIMKWSSLF